MTSVRETLPATFLATCCKVTGLLLLSQCLFFLVIVEQFQKIGPPVGSLPPKRDCTPWFGGWKVVALGPAAWLWQPMVGHSPDNHLGTVWLHSGPGGQGGPWGWEARLGGFLRGLRASYGPASQFGRGLGGLRGAGPVELQ